jgi:hypothetical protein
MVELSIFDVSFLTVMIALLAFASYRAGKHKGEGIVSEPVNLCQEVMERACAFAEKKEHERLLQFLRDVTGKSS